MSNKAQHRAILMAADIRDSGNGFHRLRFKVEGGRARMSEVTVLISLDAHRKLLSQMGRSNRFAADKPRLLKSWAFWEIGQRTAEFGIAPATITVTASDLDEFGAYAAALLSTLDAA